MSSFKFLIDTNIVIGLEDDRLVEASFAELARKCSKHNIRKFVHGAVYDDVKRDKDESRRAVTLSKLAKFENLQGLPPIPDSELVARFGTIIRENDRNDIRLLAALDASAIDFLITEDANLHKRAGRIGLGAGIFTVKEALEWIRQTFEPQEVRLPYVVEKKAYEIDRSDPIFESLREGYPGFDKWFDKCALEHRDCWVVEVGNELAGVVIRNEERHEQAQTKHPGPKILKVCTFKMKPEFRGEKFGEQLLKQILWFAQRNDYDVVYLTAFPSQTVLIELVTYYGFEITSCRPSGELVIEKPLIKGLLPACADGDFLRFARKHYPRCWSGAGVRKFCVPIRAPYHRKLFPEIAIATELPLFPKAQFGPTLLSGTVGERTPGNTIRKVYLCRAKTQALRPGDLLLFYMSKDEHFHASQSITSIGVVEQIGHASTLEDLLRMTAKRSVFSVDELDKMVRVAESPVKVIDFLLLGHIEPAVSIKTLLEEGIFRNRPPQSIAELPHVRFEILRPYLNVGYAL